MFEASQFRAEKGRVNKTIEEIAKGSEVAVNTIRNLLNDEKNGSVTLANARKVWTFLQGL